MPDTLLIRERIQRLFAEELHQEVPPLDLDLLESGRLDSLSLVDLLMHLEREFGVTVDLGEVELDQLRTVAGIANLVESFLAQDSERSPLADKTLS